MIAALDRARAWLDWKVSPMVAKEIRQGLRSRVFLYAFLIVLALLSLGVLFEFMRSGLDSSAQNYFWFLIYATFLLLMPLRGWASVSDEWNLKTLDVIQLTKLTSRQIIFGKWVSLVSQTFLLAAAVFPYLTLRYFAGGLNVVLETVTLYLLFVVSAGLTAISVCFSASAFRIVRFLGLLVVACIGGGVLWWGVGEGYGNLALSLQLGIPWMELLVQTGVVAFVVYLALAYGAKSIGQLAENHETVKRVVLLLALLLLGTLSVSFGVRWLAVPWVLLAALASVDALANPETEIPRRFVPFVESGFLGRMFAWLFSPGWASGVFYTLLIAALCLFFSFFNEDLINRVISSPVGEGDLADNIVPALAAGAGFVGTLFVVLLATRIACRKRHRMHSFVYVCFTIVAMVIGTNMALIKHEPTRALLSGIPVVGLALNDSVNPTVVIDRVERDISTARFNGNGSYTIDSRLGHARYHDSRDDSRYVHFTRSDFRYRTAHVAYVFGTNLLVVLITLYVASRQVRRNMAIGEKEAGTVP